MMQPPDNVKQIKLKPPEINLKACIKKLNITIDLLDDYSEEEIKEIAENTVATTAQGILKAAQKLISNKLVEFENYRRNCFPQANNTSAKKIVQNIIVTFTEAKDNINELIGKMKEARKLLENTEESSRDIEQKIRQIINEAKVLAQQTKGLLDNACVKDVKKLDKLSDISEVYSPVPPESKVYVEMIANYNFARGIKKNLPGVSEDVEKLRSTFNDETKYGLNIHENESKEETKQIMKKWSNKKFRKYNSIIIIIDTHGDKQNIFTADGKPIPHSSIWECFEKNPHLRNKPVLIIFEACRGTEQEQVTEVLNTATKSDSFDTSKYSPTSQGFIIVYASALDCTAYAPQGKGSHFLQQFLPLLQEKPQWDVLAQITKATQNVLYKIEPTQVQVIETLSLKPSNQTVTYVNLLHKQWKLNWTEETDNWNDHDLHTYKIGEITAILAIHETIQRENSDSLTKLKLAMEKCGIKIIKEIAKVPAEDEKKLLCKSKNASGLLILIAGLEKEGQFTQKTMPYFTKTLNQYEKYPALKGLPKLLFSLGPLIRKENVKIEGISKKNENMVKDSAGIKAMRVDVARVTEHSDVLAYCDRSEGCLEAMLEMFEHAAGNEEGLVRLLIRHVMSRQEALLSDLPPFIESTLLKKFVFQKHQQ